MEVTAFLSVDTGTGEILVRCPHNRLEGHSFRGRSHEGELTNWTRSERNGGVGYGTGKGIGAM